MFCTLEGREVSELVVLGSIPSGRASLGDGWPARTGSVPWREGNKGHVVVVSSLALLSQVKCWLWAVQCVSLLPLLHPHRSAM